MSSNIPKIHIITLGCKVNQCDAEELAHALAQMGHPVEIGIGSEENPGGHGDPALQLPATGSDTSLNAQPSTLNEVFVVNTCTVTTTADAKARKLIRRLAKDHPQAQIIVTGCYAQRAADEISKLGDGITVVPNIHKPKLADIIASRISANGGQALDKDFSLNAQRCTLNESESTQPQSHKAVVASKRTRFFLKIQDGCDHACTFCATHAVRGPMRSKPLDHVLSAITHFIEAGAQEVVLCGIRLGAYGVDFKDGTSLAKLLYAVRALPLPRLRLSSIEPLDVTEELLAEFADHPSLCHHLHLPLQSGDDTVLAEMARGYRVADYRALVARIKSIWPDLALTSDVMVGFPGESDAAFQNTLAVVRELTFTKAHIFRYSPRPHTPAAARKDQVPENVKRARLEALEQLTADLFAQHAARMIGETVEVLVEQRNSATGRWEGLTPGYLRVEIASSDPLAGKIVAVWVVSAGKEYLVSEFTS